MGPEGVEPSPVRLKVCCAALTPRPRYQVAATFQPLITKHVSDSLKSSTKSLGVELNHLCRCIRTTCFRYTTERTLVALAIDS